jgi:1-acyl-sn-glycerol-3-phosphate acyltransferase
VSHDRDAATALHHDGTGARAARRRSVAPGGLALATRRIARASLLGAEIVGFLRARGDEAEDRTAERMRKQCWFAENLCSLHGVHTTVTGRVPTGPCVIVANHLGYVDPLAICMHVAAAPVIKAEVRGWPIAGGILARFAGLFVERGDAHSGARVLLRALDWLRRGIPVVGFPEGTTTAGDRLLPFKRGLFGLARIADVPVVPVGVRFEDPDLCWVGDAPFLPHYLRVVSRPANLVHLAFGEPISPASAPDAEQLAGRAHQAVRALVSTNPS